MQSSLAVNSQCAVSRGGHVVLQIMFILPYWSTKFLPSHSGDTQRDFEKKNINPQPFAKITQNTFSIRVGKHNLYECYFEKSTGNHLKKHNLIKSFYSAPCEWV